MYGQDVDWRSRIPELSGDTVTAALLDAATVIKLKQGQMAFDKGTRCQAFLLLLEGSLCVQLLGESGRQVTLYRVTPGTSCVLTTSCLLGDQHYPAIGIVESAVSALQLSRSEFYRALDGSSSFRRFVFGSLGVRLAEVMRRMDAVSFASIDVRLAAALRAAAVGPGQVTCTHDQLAVELGTAREVVSRHLKRFEQAGWVTLGRGRIDIRDAQALAFLAEARLV